jgi:serine/threonine protein kinase
VSAEYRKDEEAIFNKAIKIKAAAERAAFVKSACGDDAALLVRVEAMLKVHFEDENFLKSPPGGMDVTLDAGPLTEGPGTKIGRYKLLQLIGEGGFGVVYMAEQQEPIVRKVALKIIKLGMDTKRVIARFEAERQALAMMDHPNIARVFDAGATDTGRPYFVMELVKGVPITEYCDGNNLDTQKRLELFIDVCKAVQHAHQKGIIHRDIKPSNVMITLHDGKPVPKVIDFGIAKATQQRLTEKTLFTEYRQFIGTPEYMSPEQAEMSGLDIDTRSDIYSLGVLLYELLTGTTPFEADKLRSAAYDEIRRIIREDEPPKPSTRLSILGDALTDIAKHRDTHPNELCKIVRGDLDWVVMKALEKDRTRRYEMADGLAADIQRHLQNEPVVAHPPSNFYRFQKWVCRNKLDFAAASAVTVALILGFGVSTWVHRYRSSLAGIETIRREELADARKRLGNDDPNLPNYIIALVNVLKANGKPDEARLLAEEAVELFHRHPGWPAPGREESLSTLNIILKNFGDWAAAASAQAERLRSLRARLPADDPALRDALANSLGEYTWTLLCAGHFAEAEAPAREVLSILEEKHDEVEKFWVQSMLGESLWMQKRYAEAELLLLSACEGANAHKDEVPDGWRDLFLGEPLRRIMSFYEATGRPEEAAKWRNKYAEFERAEAARKTVKP